MPDHIARRLLASVPTLLLASLIVFVTIRLIPGNVIDLMLSANDVGAGGMNRAALEAALGYDRPMLIQYFHWIGGILFRADLGHSLWHATPVADEIAQRLPITFELGLLAMMVALSLAIPLGVYSAIRQDSAADYAMRMVSILMLAIPGFWVGTLVVVFPSIWWGWSPDLQFAPFSQDPIRNLSQMLVPSVILGLGLSATTMRMIRAAMLEVLRQDFIRTAAAKGLPERRIVMRHALRNALIPALTLVGLQAPILIGGAVIMEQIFVIPGMGLLLLEAVSERDYPVVAGVFLVVGVAVLAINLLIDLCYGLLDPRLRTQ
jgi:peptide/nickel transport system permease protein